MRETVLLFMIMIYGFMAIFTYGHAANKINCSENFPDCQKEYMALFPATAWPLYWSWYLQKDGE